MNRFAFDSAVGHLLNHVVNYDMHSLNSNLSRPFAAFRDVFNRRPACSNSSSAEAPAGGAAATLAREEPVITTAARDVSPSRTVAQAPHLTFRYLRAARRVSPSAESRWKERSKRQLEPLRRRQPRPPKHKGAGRKASSRLSLVNSNSQFAAAIISPIFPPSNHL